MSNTVYAENLVDHLCKTDKATCHIGEATIGWLRAASVDKRLETGAREYQREKVATVAWKQNIMRTILSNTYARIPQIHIRVMNHGEGNFELELIDGQQRVTATFDFLDGSFKLPDDLQTYDKIDVGGLSAKELMKQHPKVYNRIKQYSITTMWYENLSDDQVSELFVEVLNNTNDMNAQEIRNAMRGLFSTYVRNRSRFEDKHKLFLRGIDPKNEKQVLVHLPKLALKGRMEVDEWLSQVIYLYEHGLVKGISNKKLTDWARKIQSGDGFAVMGSIKFKPYRSEWDALLDESFEIITSVSSTNKHRLTPMSAMILVLYANEIEKKGSVIKNRRDYTNAFFATIEKWSDHKTKLYMNETTVGGKQMPPMIELFGGKNENAIATIVKILDKEVAANSKAFGLTKLDSRESFTKEDIFKKWKEQDYKCRYTGRVLAEDELIGDHYIPRSWGIEMGGVTEYSNLAVTDKIINQQKLNMHGDDFIKMLRATGK